MSGQGLIPLQRHSCLLFDLDGTLLDTALDLIAALNAVRASHGLSAMDPQPLRRLVSRGGRRLLQEGFPEASEATIDALLPEFLRSYAEGIADHTRAFDDVEAFLDRLDAHQIAWGIVTNNPIGLTRQLLNRLGWQDRTSVVIGGDSLVQRKPHPAPLLHALMELGGTPAQAWMIGDDARDIEAGQAAGCGTIVAGWGYLDEPDAVASWGADHICWTPQALAERFALPR